MDFGFSNALRRATPADAAAIARMHVESWLTTYRGLLPDAVLDRLSLSQREAMWQRILSSPDPEEAVWGIDLADSDGITGFSSCCPLWDRPGGPEGELRALYLLATHQGRGWGRQLLLASLRHLQHLGFRSMWAWVLDGNPAAQLYQACGGQIVDRKTVQFAGQPFDEIAFALIPTTEA